MAAALLRQAQDKVERAGIANVSVDRGMLVLCGTRFSVEACACGELGCDGINLRPVCSQLQQVPVKPPMARNMLRETQRRAGDEEEATCST